MIESFVTDSAEALAAISADGDKNVWINGKTTVIYTGEDFTPQGEIATVLDEVVVEVKPSKKSKVVEAPVVEEVKAPEAPVVDTQIATE